jgi:LDH2 family malate/lactate/ureidoglycolate dehydrogenase
MLYKPRCELIEVCARIFEAAGVSAEGARDSAEILVAADAKGIRSHGIVALKRYIDGLKAGLIKSKAEPKILHETPCSLVLDDQGGVGLSLSKNAMKAVMGKAKEHGMAVCSVRDSNHYGIASFYTEMAARQDMIGISMTNTAALGVPTFAREAAFGTNPIACAAPGLDGKMFSLDMATTTVTRGTVDLFRRAGKQIPPGWAVGTNGLATTDPVSLLDDMLYQRGGGLLPLGGEGTQSGGHKGYGLAVLVDTLCAIASGGTFGRAVKDTAVTSARVCHFFMALRLDIFRPAEDFKRDMSALLTDLSSLKPAEGAERVYYPGQKEQEAEEECERRGVPVDESVWETILAMELG